MRILQEQLLESQRRQQASLCTELAASKEDLIIRGKGGSGRQARSHLWGTSHRAGVLAQFCEGSRPLVCVHHLFLSVDSFGHVGDAARRVHLDVQQEVGKCLWYVFYR